MGEIIYWKQYDEPIRSTDARTLKEYVLEGEFVCTDERVSNVWSYVSFHPTSVDNADLQYVLALFFKDKSRKEFKSGKIPKNDLYEFGLLIQEAEEYIKSLP